LTEKLADIPSGLDDFYNALINLNQAGQAILQIWRTSTVQRDADSARKAGILDRKITKGYETAIAQIAELITKLK
jgi:hypothetical protein